MSRSFPGRSPRNLLSPIRPGALGVLLSDRMPHHGGEVAPVDFEGVMRFTHRLEEHATVPTDEVHR